MPSQVPRLQIYESYGSNEPYPLYSLKLIYYLCYNYITNVTYFWVKKPHLTIFLPKKDVKYFNTIKELEIDITDKFVDALELLQRNGLKLSAVSRQTGINYEKIRNIKKGNSSANVTLYKKLVARYPNLLKDEIPDIKIEPLASLEDIQRKQNQMFEMLVDISSKLKDQDKIKEMEELIKNLQSEIEQLKKTIK